MNLVLDEAEEVHLKRKTRKPLGMLFVLLLLVLYPQSVTRQAEICQTEAGIEPKTFIRLVL